MQLRPMPSADRLQVLKGHRCMPMPRIVSFLDRRERGSGRIQRQLMVLRTKRAMAAFDALCWVCEKKVERTVPNPEMFLIIIRTVCTYIYNIYNNHLRVLYDGISPVIKVPWWSVAAIRILSLFCFLESLSLFLSRDLFVSPLLTRA